ncbi:MAG TPA: pyridoxamine 5'-phosphate oxidase family protein [Isosphaeraceae bacterium]|nr:pyridoxamine 5'-phosphate oxidase family protein [Isosphaeraceae bacterium]
MSQRSAPYAEAVPAVVRALDVLEHLGRIPEGRTLSQLGRDLRISPSSLSAILRTLVRRGYLARDGETGRYRLARGLPALDERAEGAAPLEQATAAVLALARVILADPSGERSDDAARREVRRALGLIGQRLAALLLDEPAPGPVEPATEGIWQAAASGPLGPTDLARFLAEGRVATLSCLGENGYPYSVPVWYQWEDGRFWVVARAGARWAHCLERNPRVSLAISESSPPLRRVLVEGNAEPVTGPGSVERIRAIELQMAARYLGPAAASYLAAMPGRARRAFVIVPGKLVTWHGLAPHPRYQGAGGPAAGDRGVA